MTRQPVYSSLQWPHLTKKGGPTPFLFNTAGPLGRIQGFLDWRLFDFCRIHQIVYIEIGSRTARLDAFWEEHKDKLALSPDGTDEEEAPKTRVLDNIHAHDMENRNVIGFVDQMTVVGLWAIGEQFLGSVYREICGIRDKCNPDTVKAPYKWHDFISQYSALGIDLKKCELYDDANECRALNNAIKHDPIVGTSLSSFPFFHPHVGKSLIDISLEMQRYLNGVSDFLGSLIEIANTKCMSMV